MHLQSVGCVIREWKWTAVRLECIVKTGHILMKSILDDTAAGVFSQSGCVYIRAVDLWCCLSKQPPNAPKLDAAIMPQRLLDLTSLEAPKSLCDLERLGKSQGRFHRYAFTVLWHTMNLFQALLNERAAFLARRRATVLKDFETSMLEVTYPRTVLSNVQLARWIRMSSHLKCVASLLDDRHESERLSSTMDSVAYVNNHKMSLVQVKPLPVASGM